MRRGYCGSVPSAPGQAAELIAALRRHSMIFEFSGIENAPGLATISAIAEVRDTTAVRAIAEWTGCVNQMSPFSPLPLAAGTKCMQGVNSIHLRVVTWRDDDVASRALPILGAIAAANVSLPFVDLRAAYADAPYSKLTVASFTTDEASVRRAFGAMPMGSVDAFVQRSATFSTSAPPSIGGPFGPVRRRYSAVRSSGGAGVVAEIVDACEALGARIVALAATGQFGRPAHVVWDVAGTTKALNDVTTALNSRFRVAPLPTWTLGVDELLLSRTQDAITHAVRMSAPSQGATARWLDFAAQQGIDFVSVRGRRMTAGHLALMGLVNLSTMTNRQILAMISVLNAAATQCGGSFEVIDLLGGGHDDGHAIAA